MNDENYKINSRYSVGWGRDKSTRLSLLNKKSEGCPIGYFLQQEYNRNKMKKETENTDLTNNNAKLHVMRCGDCLFAQGGYEFKFRNGEINYRYECTLKSRNGNIVFLDSQNEHYRWHNQKACEDFESVCKSLKKRTDLDHTKFDFLSDGHFEILP